jgi:hypothetical protein
MEKRNQNISFALKTHNILNPRLQTPSVSFALQLIHSLVDSLLLPTIPFVLPAHGNCAR